MTDRFAGLTGALLALVFLLLPVGGQAMSLKDCSTKYQAAKKDGSLGTRTWAEFRHADCADAAGATAVAAAASAPAVQAGTAPAQPAAPAVAAGKPASTAALAPSGPPPADLPTAIDAKFAAEKPAKGRLHTCAESYRAHKKAGTLNGLKWLQKGGGFYSLCNRKLKAAG